MAEVDELALATVSLATGLLRNILDHLPSQHESRDELFQIRELIKIPLKSASVNDRDGMGLKPPYDRASEQLEQLLEIYKKLQPLQERLRKPTSITVAKRRKNELRKEVTRWMTRKLSKKSISEKLKTRELIERELAVATQIGEKAIRLYQQLVYREISEGRSDSR
jgi:hypothetical protein